MANVIRGMKNEFGQLNGTIITELLKEKADKIKKEAEKGKAAGVLNERNVITNVQASNMLNAMAIHLDEMQPDTGISAFKIIKSEFDVEKTKLMECSKKVRDSLENMFLFCENVFPEGQELIILVTELTLRPTAARFIGKYGSDGYFRNNKNLLFYERKTDILRQIDELNLDRL